MILLARGDSAGGRRPSSKGRRSTAAVPQPLAVAYSLRAWLLWRCRAARPSPHAPWPRCRRDTAPPFNTAPSVPLLADVTDQAREQLGGEAYDAACAGGQSVVPGSGAGSDTRRTRHRRPASYKNALVVHRPRRDVKQGVFGDRWMCAATVVGHRRLRARPAGLEPAFAGKAPALSAELRRSVAESSHIRGVCRLHAGSAR